MPKGKRLRLLTMAQTTWSRYTYTCTHARTYIQAHADMLTRTDRHVRTHTHTYTRIIHSLYLFYVFVFCAYNVSLFICLFILISVKSPIYLPCQFSKSCLAYFLVDYMNLVCLHGQLFLHPLTCVGVTWEMLGKAGTYNLQ